MPPRRTRSRDLASSVTNPRTTGNRSVTRPAVSPDAIGAEQVAPGTVHPTHMGRHVSDEPHVQPAMIPRETFGWEQMPSRSPIVVERTNAYPVRRGGRPKIIVTVTTALTSAGEIVFYKNGVLFSTLMADSLMPGPWTLTIPTGSTGIVASQVFDIQYREGDWAEHEVTNAGVAGKGLMVVWQFG
jgi:hypothetical protein